MLEKRWVYKKKAPDALVRRLSSQLNVKWILPALLIQRDIEDFDSAKKFFNPQLDDLHEPFLMKDMRKAVDRILEALELGEGIMVYGDYDVDGTTSVALMYGFLRMLGYPELKYYIPDRYKEGYGISFKGIDYAEENDISLIIALDCGIKAVDKIDYANEKNIDFIICDHHTPGEEVPKAKAILNPKQIDCEYPYKELSGCGIGFKLIQALCEAMERDPRDAFAFLDLLAISIASDIVSMTGENRLMCYHGLKKINEQPSPGIAALMHIASLDNNKILNVRDLVFGLGPRINAAGRIEKATNALELLIEKDFNQALNKAGAVDTQNTQRREFDTNITHEAIEMIRSSEKMVNSKTTVLFKEDWHKGVIGIVASRCIEHYHRPTIIFTESNGMATGSARSVPEYNIYEAILTCEDMLESFGGHKFAAGLTIRKERLEDFREKFEETVSNTILPEQLIPKIDVDLEIELSEITEKLIENIERMSPFGPDNMRPVFVSKNVRLYQSPNILKEKHLKMKLVDEKSEPIEAIGFGMAEFERFLEPNKTFSICYSLSINEFRGIRSIQLLLKDIKTE